MDEDPDVYPVLHTIKYDTGRPPRRDIDWSSDFGIEKLNASITKILRETFQGNQWVTQQRIY